MPAENEYIPRGREGRADCTSYEPGHTPNLVAVQLSAMSPPEDWQDVVVMAVEGVEVTLAAGERLHRYRTHDAALLAVLIRHLGPRALLNTDTGILSLAPREDGTSPLFSVQRSDRPFEPCRPTAT